MNIEIAHMPIINTILCYCAVTHIFMSWAYLLLQVPYRLLPAYSLIICTLCQNDTAFLHYVVI